MITVLFLFSSMNALATPFFGFFGEYTPSSTPQVAMTGFRFCDWQGFHEIIRLSIYEKDGIESADLTSNLGGAQLHTYMTFQEYAVSNDWVKETAKISGDANSAVYQGVTISAYRAQVLTWSIFRTSSKYHLRLSDELTERGNRASCIYDVDLTRR